MIYPSFRCNLPTCRLRTFIQSVVFSNVLVPSKLDQVFVLIHEIRACPPLPLMHLLGQLPKTQCPTNPRSTSALIPPYQCQWRDDACIIMWSLFLRGLSCGGRCGRRFVEAFACFPDILVSHDSLSSIKFDECPCNARIGLYLLNQLLYSSFYFC